LRCSATLADVDLARSDLTTAPTRAADTLSFAREHGWAAAPAGTQAHVTQGWLALHRLDDAAAERLARLPDVPERDTDPTLLLSARLLRTFARFGASADRHEVVLGLREIWDDVLPAHVQPQLAATAHLGEQRLALEVGATAWVADVPERASDLLGETGDVALLRAVAEVSRGRARTARHVLAPVLDGDVAVVTPLSLVTAWLWEARLAVRAGDDGRAAAALARAITVAGPLGVSRPLAQGGPEIAELLSRGAGSFGHDEDFVDQVRASMSPVATLEMPQLTARELELLTELPSMRTAEEIAATMQLSVNTVKTHIRGIYRKLEVTNRRDAVVTARRRGLL
jgi:LuxR family maltose regulon positive regulatory protein